MSASDESLRGTLREIESLLRELQYWSATPPEAAAFESILPFFADRMSFENWLQWVLLPRFHACLDGRFPLPAACHISPMAEEVFSSDNPRLQALLQALKKLDSHFTQQE